MPEVRLINAIELVRYMCGACPSHQNGECIDKMCWKYEDRVRIENAPTIEATPVRHGRWNEKGHCECCGYDMGIRVDKWTNVYNFQFCPNCGARMDGGGEQE